MAGDILLGGELAGGFQVISDETLAAAEDEIWGGAIPLQRSSGIRLAGLLGLLGRDGLRALGPARGGQQIYEKVALEGA